MSRKCWRELEFTKDLGVQKFKGYFAWRHGTSFRMTNTGTSRDKGKVHENIWRPECRRTLNPSQEVGFPPPSSCNVLLIVCLTTHLHVSVFSISASKDYICYNWIFTIQRRVGIWVMSLTHHLWMSMIVAPVLYNGKGTVSMSFIASFYCVLWFECDMPMTWNFDMVTESNSLPKLPPDDSLIC